jgi:acid phosphatase class B
MKNRIIVDVDGTISKVGDRLKFLLQDPVDWDSFYDACFEDEPIPEVIQLVQDLYESGNQIIFCTGRRESCREATRDWFKKYFKFSLTSRSLLVMRPNNDFRHDTEVKPEMLKNAGIELDTIAFVLEDRNSMVAKWRELGLICLQVAEGDF